jgi:hypothetical protein
MINKKRILLAFLCALLAIFALAFLMFDRGPITVSPVKLPFTREVTTIHSPDGKNLIFSNGRFIASYDTITGSTKKLSNTDSLPPVTEIVSSPSDPGLIAFQTLEQIDVKVLRDLILAHNEKLNQSLAETEQNPYKIDSPTWWLLDSSTGKLEFISQSPKVEWDKSALVFIDGGKLVSYDTRSQRLVELYVGREIHSFHKEGQKLIMETSDGVILYDRNSGIEKDLNADGYIMFNSSNSCYLAILAKENREESDVFLNNCPGEDHIGSTEGEEQFYGFTADGNILVYKEGLIEVLDTKLKRIHSWHAPTDFDFLKIIGGDKLVFERAGLMYIANLSGKVPPSIEDRRIKKIDGLILETDPGTQSINIELEEGLVEASSVEYLKEISAWGYNPDLYSIFVSPRVQ